MKGGCSGLGVVGKVMFLRFFAHPEGASYLLYVSLTLVVAPSPFVSPRKCLIIRSLGFGGLHVMLALRSVNTGLIQYVLC